MVTLSCAIILGQLLDPRVHNNCVSAFVFYGLVTSPQGWLERGVTHKIYRYCLHKWSVNTSKEGVIMLQPHSTWHQKRDDDFTTVCTRATDFHSHSILPGMRHNPAWVVKEGLKGLWKAPVNHLSLYCSCIHWPRTGTKQQGSVLLRKYHTLIKNGSFRLPSIISNSGFALSLLNFLIPMKFKVSNSLSERHVTLLQAVLLILW